MADKVRPDKSPSKIKININTNTTASTPSIRRDKERNLYPESDSDSDSSAVTVVYSPLPQSTPANPQSSPPAAQKAAPEAPRSSYEVRPPPPTASTPVICQQESHRSPSNFDSYFTGPELDLHPVHNPLRFTAGQFVEPPWEELSSHALASRGLPVNRPPGTSAQPFIDPQTIHPPAVAATHQFDVLEPPTTRPASVQVFPPLRRRPGQVARTNPTAGDRSQNPFPPTPPHLDKRSAPASVSASRPRSALASQNTNFSYPRPQLDSGGGPERFPDLASTTAPKTTNQTTDPSLRTRNRARSNSVHRENPLEYPITQQEENLAGLVRRINQDNEKEARQQTAEAAGRTENISHSGGYRGPHQSRLPLPTPLEAPIPQARDPWGIRFRNQQPQAAAIDPIDRSTTPTPSTYAAGRPRAHTSQSTPTISSSSKFTRPSALRSEIRQPNILISGKPENTGPSAHLLPRSQSHSAGRQSQSEGSRSVAAQKTDNKTQNAGDLNIWRVEIPHVSLKQARKVFQGGFLSGGKIVSTRTPLTTFHEIMNFQGYGESPQSGPSNPRQAPPSPSQGMNHQNGVNGGMGPGAGLIGYPTPAGHQSDLNYVMSMVDELAGVLRMNQQLTQNVVEKMGRVREKAKNLNLSNDDLIGAVAGEMVDESQNLDKEISELRKALEDSEYNKHQNFKLAVHGAEILADIAEKVHKFKASHEADTLAWHKNYRKQLADEREENLRLRNEMNDLKAAASRANTHVRDMRRYLTDNDERHDLRVENHRLRTEKRFWKRLALPLIPDDDSEWSDDDDLIDPEEKKRLDAALKEKERIAKEDGDGEGDSESGAISLT